MKKIRQAIGNTFRKMSLAEIIMCFVWIIWVNSTEKNIGCKVPVWYDIPILIFFIMNFRPDQCKEGKLKQIAIGVFLGFLMTMTSITYCLPEIRQE